MKYIGIKQAVKEGYIKCSIPGVADFSYPMSKLRRGRVQGGGRISPTITTTSGVCKIIKWGGKNENGTV
jgi:DNA (cytosine-5)-methyltransferase 1